MWWFTVAHAGVWVHDAGSGYAQVAVAHQQAGKIYLPGGQVVPQNDEAILGTVAPLFDDGRLVVTDLTAYGELGLGRSLEVFGSVPIRSIHNKWSFAEGPAPDLFQQNFGLGDLSAGVRYGRTWRGWAASAGASARIPLYNNRPKALNVAAGDSDFEDNRVPLGQGTFDVDLFGGIGRGFGGGWALGEAGVRLRTRQFSTVIPARVQLGWKPFDAVSAWVGLDLAASLGDGAAPDFFRDQWGKGPIVIDNQSSLTFGLGGMVAIRDGYGVIATFSHVVWGQRFPVLTGGTLGVTRRFSR